MPRVAKTFAFGRKKRRGPNAKPRGRHATTQVCEDEVETTEDVDMDEPTSPVQPLAMNEFGPSSSAPQIDSEPAPVEDDEETETQTNSSRCEQKMSAFVDHSSSPDPEAERYYLVHSSFFLAMLDIIVCPFCFGSDLSLDASSDIGMACRFTVECNTCQKPVWSKCTSPKSTRRHDINVRAVVASKECGVPLSTMKTMFSIMNMPNVMHHKTFHEIGLEVREAAIGAAEEVMSASARVIKERHQSNVYATERSSPSGVQVVNVSYDGTWHKRGHSSHYGVGVAIDVDSGYVLDTYTVSNFCTGYTRAPDPDSSQYLSWFERHKPLCNKNFYGSSNAMEKLEQLR